MAENELLYRTLAQIPLITQSRPNNVGTALWKTNSIEKMFAFPTENLFQPHPLETVFCAIAKEIIFSNFH